MKCKCIVCDASIDVDDIWQHTRECEYALIYQPKEITMNTQVTYTVSLAGKPLHSGLQSIQEAFIRAGTHDNYPFGFYTDDVTGEKTIVSAMSPSHTSVNELKNGLATVNEKDKQLNAKLADALNVGVFHSRYFDMAITRVEQKPPEKTLQEKFEDAEKELTLAATEVATLNAQITVASTIIADQAAEIKTLANELATFKKDALKNADTKDAKKG